MSNRTILAAAVLAIATGASSQAFAADGSASTTISVRAQVPVICRVELSSHHVRPNRHGIVDLGSAHEFCNAPRGYRVLMQHPANLRHAALWVGGERIPLSPGGETMLTDSDQPNARSVRVKLDLGHSSVHCPALGVRIEAKS
ncbi:MAG: hypothetical protein IT546_08020 [Caulobacteraceae bacterium]|nr:hypothetical protein [Caulobacteraceae bacterium]